MEAAFITPITPMKAWEITTETVKPEKEQDSTGEATMFRSIFNQVVGQVYETEADVENKKYLLATGQLDDAHSLPIAEAKAALSLDVMISLRNKVMESYNELIKMNV